MLQKIENHIFNGPAIKGFNFLEQPNYSKATALRKDVLAQLQQNHSDTDLVNVTAWGHLLP